MTKTILHRRYMMASLDVIVLLFQGLLFWLGGYVLVFPAFIGYGLLSIVFGIIPYKSRRLL